MAVWARNVKMTDPLVVTAGSALRESVYGPSREVWATSGSRVSDVKNNKLKNSPGCRCGVVHHWVKLGPQACRIRRQERVLSVKPRCRGRSGQVSRCQQLNARMSVPDKLEIGEDLPELIGED